MGHFDRIEKGIILDFFLFVQKSQFITLYYLPMNGKCLANWLQSTYSRVFRAILSQKFGFLLKIHYSVHLTLALLQQPAVPSIHLVLSLLKSYCILWAHRRSHRCQEAIVKDSNACPLLSSF